MLFLAAAKLDQLDARISCAFSVAVIIPNVREIYITSLSMVLGMATTAMLRPRFCASLAISCAPRNVPSPPMQSKMLIFCGSARVATVI